MNMPALATRNRSAILEAIQIGTESLIPDYYTSLKAEGATRDDVRKGIEMGLRALGLNNSENVTNLPTLSLVVNGCNVSFDVKPPAPEPQPELEVVQEVAKDALPPTEPTTSVNMTLVDNMLDSLT